MERSVDVATGESVAFSYELAGLGSRFIAVAADMAIQFAVALAAFVALAWLGNASGASAGTHAVRPGAAAKFGSAVVGGAFVFAAFLLFFGYFIVFEWRFEGRTPGKRLIGIRVVRDGGFALDFTSAVVRNVVRILEFGLGFYAVSALATLLSPLNRRLGDMAAGTIVVREARMARGATLPEYAETERPLDLARELSPAERELVTNYLERRATLAAEPRRLIAKRIADGIRPKLAATFSHLDDDDLLAHVAGLR